MKQITKITNLNPISIRKSFAKCSTQVMSLKVLSFLPPKFAYSISSNQTPLTSLLQNERARKSVQLKMKKEIKDFLFSFPQEVYFLLFCGYREVDLRVVHREISCNFLEVNKFFNVIFVH